MHVLTVSLFHSDNKNKNEKLTVHANESIQRFYNLRLI